MIKNKAELYLMIHKAVKAKIIPHPDSIVILECIRSYKDKNANE